MEAYEKYVERQAKIASGEIQPEEDEEGEAKDPPVNPKIDLDGLGKMFDEQYPRFEIVAEIV